MGSGLPFKYTPDGLTASPVMSSAIQHMPRWADEKQHASGRSKSMAYSADVGVAPGSLPIHLEFGLQGNVWPHAPWMNDSTMAGGPASAAAKSAAVNGVAKPEPHGPGKL